MISFNDLHDTPCATRLADYIRDIQRWTNHALSSAQADEVNMVALKKAEVAVNDAIQYAARLRVAKERAQ